MFNLYKVKVYKKENVNGVNVISFLDNVIVNVLPEGIPFNKVNEFCTGEPLALIDSMDDIKNDSELVIFKDDMKKDNKRKFDDEMMKYYVDSFEDSMFNKFISSPKEEKLKVKEIGEHEII